MKSNSPIGTKMTSLGMYLLTSLMFVIAIMIEFAVVLYFERRADLKRGTNVKPKTNSQVPDPLQLKMKSAKIDSVTFALLLTSFFLFNLVYFAYHLNLN